MDTGRRRAQQHSRREESALHDCDPELYRQLRFGAGNNSKYICCIAHSSLWYGCSDDVLKEGRIGGVDRGERWRDGRYGGGGGVAARQRTKPGVRANRRIKVGVTQSGWLDCLATWAYKAMTRSTLVTAKY